MNRHTESNHEPRQESTLEALCSTMTEWPMSLGFAYTIRTRDFVKAIKRLSGWHKRAPGERPTMLMATNETGQLWLGASYWPFATLVLLPIAFHSRKSRYPDEPILKVFRADYMTQLAKRMESRSTDSELRIVYDNGLKEARFSWGKNERALADISHLGSENVLSPFLHSWAEPEPAFRAEIERALWLQALENVDSDSAIHTWRVQDERPGMCAVESCTIRFRALHVQLSILLPTRPLRAYLDMIASPLVGIHAYRLSSGQKTYTVRVTSPQSEFIAYCYSLGQTF